jgi:bile acid:Na+ symporter, BASS family
VSIRAAPRGRVLASSAPFSIPGFGKVGWHRREGNASILSFGATGETGEKRSDGAAGGTGDDVSQRISAMLPLVVAATGVAALSYPATFSW